MISKHGPRARGFTLLELVVVMAILVALAGLAIAKFDILQLKAEKASAASQMHNINRYIQTYRSVTNFYPDRWDSLIDRTGGTPVLRQPGAPGTTPGLDPGLVGGPPTGSSTKLRLMTAAEALVDNDVRSLTRLGVTQVLNHNGATTTPYGNGFQTLANIATGDVLATINEADASGQKILNAIYPTPGWNGTTVLAAVPAGRKLVVFGLGRYCTIVGNNNQVGILTEAPVYPYSNQQYYDRYLAVFETATSNGGRCRLVAVLGADGDLAADEISDFNAQ